MFVSRAAVQWIQRGEAGIINRKVQLNNPAIFPTEHLHLVPVENIPTPLWKLKHQSADIHFYSLSTSCCLETLHIFALCLSCTVCHSLSKKNNNTTLHLTEHGPFNNLVFTVLIILICWVQLRRTDQLLSSKSNKNDWLSSWKTVLLPDQLAISIPDMSDAMSEAMSSEWFIF